MPNLDHGRLKRLTEARWPRDFPIAQFPNAPLLVALVLAAASHLVGGSGRDYLRAGFFVALGIWAYGEITDGVNWFRRVLGVAGLVFALAGLARLIAG